MNNDPKTTQETTEADKALAGQSLGDNALGSALGSAIGARVDTAVQPPPVSLIAERAAARARARTVQRSVVGIAASVTLLAGGLFAYNALGSDDYSPAVATEPSASPSTTVPADETPTTIAVDESTLPDETATSALIWTGHEPNELFGGEFLDVYEAETVGDGRVVARAWGDTGSQIVVSGDGNSWTPVSVPTGVDPQHIDISGDRWLIAGADISGMGSGYRIVYSDDQGGNWTDVALDPIPDGPASILKALASGQNMVIVVKVPRDYTARDLQIQELIRSSGLLSDDETVESWSMQGTTVSFWTPESTDPRSFEISEDVRDALYASVGDEQVRLYTSNGGSATVTGQYVSWHTTASSNADGFYVAVTTPNDELLLTSADGLTWTETSIDDPAAFASGLRSTTRVDEWFVAGYDNEIRVKSLDQLDDPDSTTATMVGISGLGSLHVGPAGMVATAFQPPLEPAPADPILLGWSTDGITWEWLNLAETFGIERTSLVDLAVGNDFVLARVEGIVPDSLDSMGPPVWFRATVN